MGSFSSLFHGSQAPHCCLWPFHSTILTVARNANTDTQQGHQECHSVWTKDRDTFKVCTHALSNRSKLRSVLLLHDFPDFLQRTYLLLSTSGWWPEPGHQCNMSEFDSQEWDPFTNDVFKGRARQDPYQKARPPSIRITVFSADVVTDQPKDAL